MYFTLCYFELQQNLEINDIESYDNKISEINLNYNFVWNIRAIKYSAWPPPHWQCSWGLFIVAVSWS